MAMTQEQLIMQAQNKSAKEVSDLLALTRESARQWLSRKLMHHDEDAPLVCDLVLEPMGSFGISDSEKPNLTSIYMQRGEGIIWLLFEGFSEYVELDYVDVETIVLIINQLEDFI